MQYLYKTKLVELREEKNIKQYDIAKFLGFDNENSYGQFEREDTLLPLNHLNKLSNFFNVSLDYIFDFNEKRLYTDSKININYSIIGKRLKELRKDNKLTQNDLAKTSGLTKSSISKYEAGKVIITTYALYTICKKYNISADYLLGKIDSPKYLK